MLQDTDSTWKAQPKGLNPGRTPLPLHVSARISPRGLWGGDRRLLPSSSLPVSGSLLSCSRSSGLPSSCLSRSSKGRWTARTVTGKSRRSWPRLGCGPHARKAAVQAPRRVMAAGSAQLGRWAIWAPRLTSLQSLPHCLHPPKVLSALTRASSLLPSFIWAQKPPIPFRFSQGP